MSGSAAAIAGRVSTGETTAAAVADLHLAAAAAASGLNLFTRLEPSEVREAAISVIASQRQLALQRSNVELVQRSRDLVEKEYAAGQASLVRLNEAQRDLTAAHGRLALALVSLRQAWYDLETATGRTLDSL